MKPRITTHGDLAPQAGIVVHGRALRDILSIEKKRGRKGDVVPPWLHYPTLTRQWSTDRCRQGCPSREKWEAMLPCLILMFFFLWYGNTQCCEEGLRRKHEIKDNRMTERLMLVTWGPSVGITP